MFQHGARPLRREQLRAEFQRRRQASADWHHRKAEVEFRGVGTHRMASDLDPLQAKFGRGVVLQGEGDLKQRRAVGVDLDTIAIERGLDRLTQTTIRHDGAVGIKAADLQNQKSI